MGKEACSSGVAAQRPDSWRAEIRADWQRPTSLRAWLRLAAWAVAVFGLFVPVLRQTVGYDSIGFPLTLAVALLAILWVAPRQREIRTWVFYVVAIYFFTQLRDAADETSIRASTGYVLDWEMWMFNGTTPSAWLQERLGGGAGDAGPLAYLSVFWHWSWFIVPHAVVLGTFFLARQMFFRVAAIMASIFFFAVALYYLVPTVPPWLAVEQGDTTGVVRIMNDVGPTLFGQTLWDRVFAFLAEPNPRAAMPSLHFAVSFQVILIALLLRVPRLLVGGIFYSVWLTFSLIYLGEHYFADILAGGAAAAASVFLVETALGNGPGARVAQRLWAARRRLAAWPRPPSRLPRPPARAGGRGADEMR